MQREKMKGAKKDATLKYEIALKSLQKRNERLYNIEIFTTATLFYRSSFLMLGKRCIMSNTNLRDF